MRCNCCLSILGVRLLAVAIYLENEDTIYANLLIFIDTNLHTYTDKWEH